MTVDGERIRAWLGECALPLWGSAGFDEQAGGFFDALTLDGKPIRDAAKRLRVQARQTYVFSHAHRLGWTPPPGQLTPLDTAARGFDFMTGTYWRDDGEAPGGLVYAVERDGAVADARIDLYDHAFAVFACAWYLRASGDRRAKTWAAKILTFLDSELADPDNGGYFDVPARDLPRRQNPHMHLLEALLALYQTTGDADALARAGRLVALFRERFFDHDTGTLGEFFDTSWQPVGGTAGQIVEPGHHFEWTWLLYHYGAASGEDCRREADALFRFAEQHGFDSKGATAGLVYDSVLRRGVDLDDYKRMWGLTEAIKAQCARIEFADDAAARGRLEALLELLFDQFLLGDSGLWRDHLQRDGTPLRDSVPASSLYHVFLSLSEVLRVRDGVTAL